MSALGNDSGPYRLHLREQRLIGGGEKAEPQGDL